MGILKNKHGVYYVRKKVPKGLEQAVARAIESPQPSLSWLKRSLRTKDAREANVRAKPVLIEFDRVLAEAVRLKEATPLRTDLSEQEIARLADYQFAFMLDEDEDVRRDGTGSEELFHEITNQLSAAGVAFAPSFRDTQRPTYGLSDRELYKSEESIDYVLPAARKALAKVMCHDRRK